MVHLKLSAMVLLASIVLYTAILASARVAPDFPVDKDPAMPSYDCGNAVRLSKDYPKVFQRCCPSEQYCLWPNVK